MLTELSLASPDAVDVDAALRFTLGVFLSQLFVELRLPSLELVDPLQPIRRESGSPDIMQEDDQQARRDERHDDRTSVHEQWARSEARKSGSH